MAVLVGVTTAFVWSKVALADIARCTAEARTRLEGLSQERSRLTAAVTMKKKPGNIKGLVESRLDMIQATERELEGDRKRALAADG